MEDYLMLADVCTRMGDLQALKETLNQGGAATSDSVLQEKLSEVEGGSIHDAEGKLRIRTGYDGDGNFLWYHTLRYDVQGNPCSVTAFDFQGTQIDYAQYQYREAGKVLTDIAFVYDSGMLVRNCRTAMGNPPVAVFSEITGKT